MPLSFFFLYNFCHLFSHQLIFFQLYLHKLRSLLFLVFSYQNLFRNLFMCLKFFLYRSKLNLGIYSAPDLFFSTPRQKFFQNLRYHCENFLSRQVLDLSYLLQVLFDSWHLHILKRRNFAFIFLFICLCFLNLYSLLE